MGGVVATPGAVDGVRVERVVTSGTFSLDGGTWDVDNNVWLLGDDVECLVVDAAHDTEAILDAVAGRTVTAIVCTHAHDDHINQVPSLRAATGAPVHLHPDDRVLWDLTVDDHPDVDLAEGQELSVGGVTVRVLHTPGHAPGACCLYVPQLGIVLTGDTLFKGGPGATGRSYSSFDTIVRSIEQKLLTLPSETMVLTGHGEPTTIGDEAPHLQEWLDRGH